MEDENVRDNVVTEMSTESVSSEAIPRDNLVATAVKFLQNPKVRNSPLAQKRAFLDQKGLTKDEIELAIKRSNINTSSDNSNIGLVSESETNLNHQVTPFNYQAPVPVYPVKTLSSWEKVRSWSSSVLFLAGIGYVGYQFYQYFVKPLMYRQSKFEGKLTKMETKMQEIQSETHQIMKEIQESLKAIQFVVTQQQIASTDKQRDITSVNEIKSEIQSLKGLLLNKRQFPPIPSTSPLLPSWQLTTHNSLETEEIKNVIENTVCDNDNEDGDKTEANFKDAKSDNSGVLTDDTHVISEEKTLT